MAFSTPPGKLIVAVHFKLRGLQDHGPPMGFGTEAEVVTLSSVEQSLSQAVCDQAAAPVTAFKCAIARM